MITASRRDLRAVLDSRSASACSQLRSLASYACLQTALPRTPPSALVWNTYSKKTQTGLLLCLGSLLLRLFFSASSQCVCCAPCQPRLPHEKAYGELRLRSALFTPINPASYTCAPPCTPLTDFLLGCLSGPAQLCVAPQLRKPP